MNRSVDKHIPYYELLESLQNAKVCAFCEMQKRGTRRYMENLLYESVNDSVVRRTLLASRGFCRHHAEVLLSLGDGLGTAILYQDQVEEAVRFTSHLKEMSGRTIRTKASSQWRCHTPCPACAQEERNDALRIRTLLDNLCDPQIRQALEGSPGLCIPHLLASLKASDDLAARQFLLELHRGKFTRLLDDLKEFIRKHDYRYAQEKYGGESDAWRRAPKMILGDR